jgi:uncharacterized protein with GYD domain
MGSYVILSKLTDEELEKMGVKVKEQYAVLGPYDFVNIVEAKDNETVMKMSLEMGARGSVELLTLAAIPVSEIIKKIK